jgi:hypothetical protein
LVKEYEVLVGKEDAYEWVNPKSDSGDIHQAIYGGRGKDYSKASVMYAMVLKHLAYLVHLMHSFVSVEPSIMVVSM